MLSPPSHSGETCEKIVLATTSSLVTRVTVQRSYNIFINFKIRNILCSVADPDPNPDPDSPDPRVFGPPGSGSGSTSQRYGSGSGSFYHHAKIVRKTLIPPIL